MYYKKDMEEPEGSNFRNVRDKIGFKRHRENSKSYDYNRLRVEFGRKLC